jgi:hypothetical protein
MFDSGLHPTMEALAHRRAPSQTVLVDAKQARFSQQTVTANFTVTPNKTTDNITSMSESMREHGFNRKFPPMKGTLIQNHIVSHDNRRLVSAKTADIFVPMKLEHPSIQNIDNSDPEKARNSANREHNSVNTFLINRTSPSKKQGPDPETLQRGFSLGFDSVRFKTAMEYKVELGRKDKATARETAEKGLIANHPSIIGKSDI